MKINKIAYILIINSLLLGCDTMFYVKGSVAKSCYLISGKCENEDRIPIANVNVIVKCTPNSRLATLRHRDQKLITDKYGYYKFGSFGMPSLYDCFLIFTHPLYKQKVIKLDSHLHRDATTEYAYDYVIDVDLKQNNGMMGSDQTK